MSPSRPAPAASWWLRWGRRDSGDDGTRGAAGGRPYAAFMSYSHASEAELAPELQRLIRRVGRPWYSRARLRVFRDATNLQMSDDLWAIIRTALESSEMFVLLASPGAAESTWVDREVAYWREHRERSRFTIVLTDGRITWDPVAHDFDTAVTNALPPAVGSWFDHEPNWLDVRLPEGTRVRRGQRNERLRDAARTIAAPLYGMDKDQLEGEDERESRRARRTLRGGISALILLTVLAVIAGVAAYQQYLATENQLRVASARLLDAEADAVMERDPRYALRLSTAAAVIDPGSEADSALAAHVLETSYAGSLDGITGTVRSIAFRPDGRLLVTASEDGVRLWDLHDAARPRRPGARIDTGENESHSAVFSPDGRTLATAANSGDLLLWDTSVPTGPRLIGTADAGTWLHSVAFSGDGRRVVTTDRTGAVVVWEVDDPGRPNQLGPALPGHITSMPSVVLASLAPDGSFAAVVTPNGTAVALWDLADPARPQQVGGDIETGQGELTSVVISPDGRLMATAGTDGTVSLWDMMTVASPRRLGEPVAAHSSAVFSVSFAPDSQRLATASADGTAAVWDVDTQGALIRHGPAFIGHTEATIMLYQAKFSPDGNMLATAGEGGLATLWDLDVAGRPRASGAVLAGRGVALGMAFEQTTGVLAVANATDGVVMADLSDPSSPRRLNPPLDVRDSSFAALAFSPDGRYLAAVGRVNDVVHTGTGVIWDVEDPATPRRLAVFPAGDLTATAVTWSPNGRVLAVGGVSGVALWDVSDPQNPRAAEAPLVTDWTDSLAFSPDGRFLASGGFDGVVRLWDVRDTASPVTETPPLTGHNGSVYTLAFDPAGSILAAGGDDGTVLLWDVSDVAHPYRVGPPLFGHESAVWAAAFSANGRIMVTGSADGSAILWDATDASRPQRLGDALRPQTGAVLSAAFSPTANLLVTAGEGGAVVWDIDELIDVQRNPVSHACARTGTALELADWLREVAGLPYQDACANSR